MFNYRKKKIKNHLYIYFYHFQIPNLLDQCYSWGETNSSQIRSCVSKHSQLNWIKVSAATINFPSVTAVWLSFYEVNKIVWISPIIHYTKITAEIREFFPSLATSFSGTSKLKFQIFQDGTTACQLLDVVCHNPQPFHLEPPGLHHLNIQQEWKVREQQKFHDNDH